MDLLDHLERLLVAIEELPDTLHKHQARSWAKQGKKVAQKGLSEKSVKLLIAKACCSMRYAQG